jgi:hypothetical protein
MAWGCDIYTNSSIADDETLVYIIILQVEGQFIPSGPRYIYFGVFDVIYEVESSLLKQ